MRAHYFQHVPFEGLGSMEAWLSGNGYELSKTQFFKHEKLPEPGDVDFLIVMGGPMSVNDEDRHPWLAQEKQFIYHYIHTGRPVLGICLGAQLMASAMGARVYPNQAKEIGWFPISGIPAADKGCFRFPPSQDVFHWHGETFDLPAGAVRLASSEGCKNQAFQYGKAAMGLQFHLETTPASAHEMVAHCGDELAPSRFVQSAEALLAATPEKYRIINSLMVDILAFLTG